MSEPLKKTLRPYLPSAPECSVRQGVGTLAGSLPVEELVGQVQVDTVLSDVECKPYYALLSPEELQTEIEYFQANGEFRNGIEIGYASGGKPKAEKSVEPLVTELSDEELDQLEDGTFADWNKLRGQKLLGFSKRRRFRCSGE